MRSITLHNLEDSLYTLLKQKAHKEGKSLNRTIQDVLAEWVGSSGTTKKGKRKDVYDELCGALSAGELKRMEKAEKEFETIEDRDWK